MNPQADHNPPIARPCSGDLSCPWTGGPLDGEPHDIRECGHPSGCCKGAGLYSLDTGDPVMVESPLKGPKTWFGRWDSHLEHTHPVWWLVAHFVYAILVIAVIIAGMAVL